MLLTIHDANLRKVAFVDNSKTKTLNFFGDQWHRSLENATSTFSFSVFKKSLQYDTMVSKTYNVLNERSFVSFHHKGRTYLFNVMEVKETEHVIECSAEYLSMELLNEYHGAFKADRQMSFIEYMNLWGMVENNAIKIGINEVKDQKRTLEWTGEDTGLKRLLSIANKFDAEIEFVTKLKPDSSLDAFVLNIYKANDGKDIQGVGKRRNDVLLSYGKNVAGIGRTVDKTEIYNATMPIGTSNQSTDDAKKTTAAKQASGGKATYTGSEIKYGGKTLSKDNLSKIVEHCRKNDLLISGVICQLYLESNWGNSNVAKMDNNWSGMTGGAQTRPSGVVVTTGSWRPANEGGTYMHYANLDDFFKDYTYLLAHQGIYAVKGKKDIEGYTSGLFRSGGAKYDYAASGYGHYIGLMRSIRSGVNSANNGVLDKLDRGELVGNITSTPDKHSATSDPRIDKMIQWFEARQGKVTYSMQARTGPNSYDCSSAIYYAMKHAGFGNIGTWPFSTETMHDPLKREGYQLVAENRSVPLQKGDIIIWGKRGFSGGADGHVMLMKNNSDIIHCNFRHNGISTNNYEAYLRGMGRAIYTYVYRLPNQKGAGEIAPKVQAALRKADGLKNRSVGNGECYGFAAWYAKELGGPGLGAGFPMHDVIGDTMAAANIAEGYNWAKFGWKVVRGSGDIRAGGLYTVHANNAAAGTNIWGHVGVIKSVSGDKVTVLEQNYGGKRYVVQNTYNMATFKGFTKAVVYPPELAGGANINEAPKPAEPKKEEAKAAASTGTEVVEVKVDPKRYQEWKNEKGQVEFYLKNGVLYAPLSRDLYPSVLTGKETTDNWIRKDMKIETDSQDVLISSALRELRKHAYPKITYEVDGYVDLEIGDTVKIRDEGFTPTLILQARVSEQTISFTNPANNKTVFSNFVALENKVSKNLMSELEKMVEDARPYEIRLTTDNGVSFKNSNGSSLLTAQLFKGRSERQAVFIFKDLEDNFLGTSQQLEVKAEDIENVLNVVVEAYVDNVLVATTDISFTNTRDGTVGKAGPKGADGRTPYFHTAWADSEDGRLNFTVEDSANKEFMGTYTDYTPEDSTDPGMYKWVKVRGDDGQDGRGVVSYKNYYALSESAEAVSVPRGNLLLESDVKRETTNHAIPDYVLSERLVPGKTYTLCIFWFRDAKATSRKNYTPMAYLNGDLIQLVAPVNTNNLQNSPSHFKFEPGGRYATFTVPSLETMSEEQRRNFDRDEHFIRILRHGSESSKDQNDTNASIVQSVNYATLVEGTIPLKEPVKSDKELGWVPEILAVTPEKRFLWYYRMEQYSDGSVKTTEPILLAVHGEKGQDGRNGKDGKNGRDGADGAPGKDGRDGKDGAQGPKGDKGDKGDKGEQGAVGPRGERGLQGLQGPKGEQGIPGQKGIDGKTQYTHIAYADTNLGGGFSQTTNGSKAYIGMYVDFEEADSPNPSRYRWTKIKGDKGDKGDRGAQGLKGDQGVPGPKGSDGRTPYFHTAWANSEDGREGFSTTDSRNKRFIGTLTDFTERDSEDPSRYQWTALFDLVKVGSRNYAEDYDFSRGLWEYSQGDSSKTTRGVSDSVFTVTTTTATWHQWQIHSESGTRLGGKLDSTALAELKTGETYTLSFEAKVNSGNPEVWFELRDNGKVNYNNVVTHMSKHVQLTDSWVRYSVTGILKPNSDFSHRRIILGYNGIGSVSFRKVELTQSNIVTDAGEAPEDIDARFDSKADAELTTEQINRLNEQAGILIAELEAKASADIMAQWIETVKNQIKETERGKKETEQALISASQRIIALQQNMGDMQIRTDFMDTYFSQSNDGLILGRKDGSSAVRVTNDRISFVSAGKEVAFISQGVLQIDNGVFVKSLQVGRFRLEQHQSNLDMNVIRYIGGL
ncbi:phage tail protein [Streptococcus sp. 121]|uniref:peptidoglycan amidohydrolase family protein n=1 Tax=Streptococcus sp. 121 TaxID=2797637 RepID=UPI0018F073A4|nr:peptidoglycan amidohydrolase family protein [Streptococcus sp. 121]MBJ6745200.1 phage tail protein [Streptococcus sp. 121]